MKKKTLFAAAAALLISGGLFMKANQVYNINVDELIETVTASADPTMADGDNSASNWEYGVESREHCQIFGWRDKNGTPHWSRTHPEDGTYYSTMQGTKVDCRGDSYSHCVRRECFCTTPGIYEYIW